METFKGVLGRVLTHVLTQDKYFSIAIGSLNNEESTYDFDLISKFIAEFFFNFEFLETEELRHSKKHDFEETNFREVKLCFLMRYQARIFTSRLYEIDVVKTKKQVANPFDEQKEFLLMNYDAY